MILNENINAKSSVPNSDYIDMQQEDATVSSNNKLFVKTPYIKIRNIYDSYGCNLLLSEEEYNNQASDLKHIVAPYVCSCGHLQQGRSIHYFINRYQLCELCSKEKRRYETAIKLKNDYESVKQKMFSENRELITVQKYFVKNDYIEYKCLNCGTVNKIKYYVYNDNNDKHVCKGCREIEVRKQQWQDILNIAEEFGLQILTTFDEFIIDPNRIDVQCYCGNTFNVLTKEYRYKNKRQCNSCGIALRSGENSPRWKGGITTEVEKIRHSILYMEWRESVFKRDNYTCQCCGDNKGGNLQAHHIENFSSNIDKRFDIDNGITLCEQCHSPIIKGSFHDIYGVYNNNAQQLYEYITRRKQKLLQLD